MGALMTEEQAAALALGQPSDAEIESPLIPSFQKF